MKTAKFVRQIEGFRGDARLYCLSESVEYGEWDKEKEERIDKTTSYVVVSAVVAPFPGPETYIFPASEDGGVLNWSELEGSFRGGLDHVKALGRAGFGVEEG